ncbi:MAG: futalosine hydrolase [Fuerstiella sp.]
MKSLVLIPSNTEYRMLQEYVADRWPRTGQLAVEICGVGLVASAVGTTTLLHKFQPDQVFLVGIAGLLNSDQLPSGLSPEIGSSEQSKTAAIVGHSVVQHGVGIGEGEDYQSAETMGFHRFNSDLHLQTPDQITLNSAAITTDVPQNIQTGQFLSVMSASSSLTEANRRRSAYPEALLEDMETYSVALACHTAGLPLIAIRGMSNVVGDRNFENWKTQAAMHAATDVLLEYLS